jgi:hypothetical protein
MANQKEGKIGIGPEGRPAALIQFVVLTAVLTIIFVYFVSPMTLIGKILPAILPLLIALGFFALAGDNFPLAPPGGNWNPTKSRLTAGLGMTAILAVAYIIFLVIMLYAIPKWPMSPLFVWWGALGFCTTLLYTINWNCFPVKGKVHPWVASLVACIVVIVVASLVWTFLTNAEGTPFAGSPFNHKGPFQADWLTGWIVWFICWIFVFNPVFVTQQWPFAKLGHPGGAIAQTIVAFILATICWKGTFALGINPGLSAQGVASSMIFWALVYSWHFQFWGVTKLTGGARAIAAFVVVVIITAIWVPLCHMFLGPAADNLAVALNAAGLPPTAADVNTLILYLNLCILAPALIIHNAWWLRWPLTLPTPPGTPPSDQSV